MEQYYTSGQKKKTTFSVLSWFGWFGELSNVPAGLALPSFEIMQAGSTKKFAGLAHYSRALFLFFPPDGSVWPRTDRHQVVGPTPPMAPIPTDEDWTEACRATTRHDTSRSGLTSPRLAAAVDNDDGSGASTSRRDERTQNAAAA